MDEPTSALSVEGADRVVELTKQLQSQGISIILISHNIEYMRKVADRIKVLHNGHDAGDLPGDATRDDIISRMVSGFPATDDEVEAETGTDAGESPA
jgi:ABC-type sugar transport system ATPase subunit